MSEMLQKIERLQAKSLHKTQELQQSKQNTWKQIQQQFPKIAEFALAINEEFGKPKAFGVKVNDDVMLNTRGWQKSRDLSIKLENKRWGHK